MDVRNRHWEYKNKRIYEIGSGTKLFITFELKRFSTWGERGTIFLCWLVLHRHFSTQLTRGARSAQSRLASPSSESQPSCSEAGTQLCFFSNLSPRFRCVTSPKYPGFNSYLGFLFWYLWMIHPLRARVNTCVNFAPN